MSVMMPVNMNAAYHACDARSRSRIRKNGKRGAAASAQIPGVVGRPAGGTSLQGGAHVRLDLPLRPSVVINVHVHGLARNEGVGLAGAVNVEVKGERSRADPARAHG